MEKIKYVHRQDSGFKLGAGNSGETSLNLSNEIFDLIAKGSMQLGEEKDVTFKIYKEDCIRAICFIVLKLPLYQSSSNASTKITDGVFIFQKLIDKVESIFGNNESVDYTVNLYYRTDGRIYLNRLKVGGFSIRDVLVENNSALLFKEEPNGQIAIRILSDIKDGEDIEDDYESRSISDPIQIIYYGAPGTGKSREVKLKTGELLENGDEVDLPNVFRTTFHPDTDYASFVGCYKPAMESKEPIYTKAQLIDKLSIIKNSGASYPCQKFGAKYWESLKELLANDIKDILSACGFTDSMGVEVQKGVAIGEDFDSQNSNKQIVYRFVPQVFTDAYVYAYTTKEPTYLVIEEINRGNCAQIFGDLFQLLDRKNGESEYKVKADKDLAQYLRDQLGFDSEGIQDGKLCLPKNLHILATMNTSDQSLFPMDSAFKRRWEWEYVPIDYAKEDIESSKFEIIIGENSEEKKYSWVDFIEKLNEKIFALTQSEDKQMGNFFIKHSIDEKGFKSKVMFYLWYEVLRDETENNKYFFYKKITVEGKEELSKFTFKDLFGDKATETLQQFMEYLEVAPK